MCSGSNGDEARKMLTGDVFGERVNYMINDFD